MIRNYYIFFTLVVGSDGDSFEWKNGDVKLNKDGTPFIFWDNLWSPLCGHYFWDNQYGADKFCQKLGYASGRHSGKPIPRTYPVDSFNIGTCLETDEWPCCTGGENYFALGSTLTNGTCDKSNDEAILIACIGDPKYVNNPSCKGKWNAFVTTSLSFSLCSKKECHITNKLQYIFQRSAVSGGDRWRSCWRIPWSWNGKTKIIG